MMRHSYAPKGNGPPALFGRYILFRDYGIPWDDTGVPLDMDEIGMIVEMAGVWAEAQRMKDKMRR